jgi:hypothetical protein
VSWTQLGAHTVRVRVTDADGATDTKSLDVTVANASPIALLTIGPSPGLTGQAVLFDASASSDPDGTVAKYEWDLDGNGVYELDTGTTATTSRTYPNQTLLAVGVRVTDNDGATATKLLSLAVNAPVVVDPGTNSGGGTTAPPTTTPPATAPGATAPGTGKTGTGTGTGGGGTGTGGGDSSDRASLAASLTGTAIQPLKTALKSGVRIGCQADRAAACSVTAIVQPADAKRLKLARGKKAYTVGTAQVDAARAKDGTIVIRLPAKLRKALKRKQSVLIVVRGKATDATGHSVELARAILLRR